MFVYKNVNFNQNSATSCVWIKMINGVVVSSVN